MSSWNLHLGNLCERFLALAFNLIDGAALKSNR